jgi:hypothetical protein
MRLAAVRAEWLASIGVVRIAVNGRRRPTGMRMLQPTGSLPLAKRVL